jgi:hypothetical protein
MSFLRTDAVFQLLCNEDDFCQRLNILVDSGGYSNYFLDIKAAFHDSVDRRRIIEMEDYITMAGRFSPFLWNYIALDVPRNNQQTLENLKYLREKGYNPMPVATSTEELQVIRDEIIGDSKWLAVAGGAYKGSSPMTERIPAIRTVLPDAKFHALGYAKIPEVFHLGIHSIDSSTWCSGGQYGTLRIFDPIKGYKTLDWKKLVGGKMKNNDFLYWYHYATQIIGCDNKMMLDKENYRRTIGIPAMSTVFSAIMFADYCFEKGLLYFLAVPNSQWLTVYFSVLGSVDVENRTMNINKARELKEYLSSVSYVDYLEELVKILNEKTEVADKLDNYL